MRASDAPAELQVLNQNCKNRLHVADVDVGDAVASAVVDLCFTLYKGSQYADPERNIDQVLDDISDLVCAARSQHAPDVPDHLTVAAAREAAATLRHHGLKASYMDRNPGLILVE